MADRSYIPENDAARERLRVLVSRLSDEEMGRPLGDGWTVAAGLCHLAFWDRLWLGKFEEWDRAGAVPMPTPWPAPIDADRINGAMLPWWLTVSFDRVRQEAVAAAEAVDRRVATVSDAVVEQILAARSRTIIRAVHRREHLDQIERALGR
ncbi:MAG TPA: DinB family protein [Chloroflexota bacterium]